MPRQKVTLATILDAVQNIQQDLTGFKNEMREFKNEMYEFKNEMLSFKEESFSVFDHLIKSQDTFQTELLAVHHSKLRHEDRITALEQKRLP